MLLAHRRSLPVAMAIALAAASAPVVVPATAWAQDADDAKYKQHMTNGVKLYQDRNWKAAIAEFEAAYAVKPKASPLVNIALCHKAQFRYPQAITTLETALAKHVDTMSAADKKAAEDAIVELKALLGFITVELAPPGAIVSVDGEDLPKGAAAKPIPLGPGTHKIRARAEGYAAAEKQVTVASGDKGQTVQLTLTPDKGWVSILARDPKHAIAIDQKVVGHSRWSGFLSPGTHLVQIYKPGSSVGYSQQVVVTAGKVLEVDEGKPVGWAPNYRGSDQPDEPEKPPPFYQGFYALAQGGFYGIVGRIAGEPGYVLGARVGWRPNTVVGLEAMFQYGHAEEVDAGSSFAIREDGSSFTIDGHYAAMDSVRMGGNLRLMTRGRVARFVGTLGPGLAIDVLDFKASECIETERIECYENDNSALGFYVNTEVGMEFDFSGFFFGAVLQQMVSTVGGLQGPEGVGDLMLHVGLQLRVGYGTW